MDTNLKTRINEDFKIAFKAGDRLKKDCLGMLKTKITEAEKKGGSEIDDTAIVNVISTYNKQLQQTIDTVNDNNNPLTINAKLEQTHISVYLPQQMTENEMREEACKILDVTGDKNHVIGKAMNYFKTNFNGRYNPGKLKQIIDTIIS